MTSGMVFHVEKVKFTVGVIQHRHSEAGRERQGGLRPPPPVSRLLRLRSLVRSGLLPPPSEIKNIMIGSELSTSGCLFVRLRWELLEYLFYL